MNLDHHESEGAPRSMRRRNFLLGVVAVVAFGGMLGLDVGVARADSNPLVVIDGVGQFEVLSYSWGSTSSAISQSGAPNSKVHDLSFTKYVDSISPTLSAAAASGQVFATASITVVGKNGKLVRYEMTAAFVSAYSVGSGTPTGNVTENVTLTFANVKAAHR
jgi:type VI protein secretion system component Hcp